MSRAKVFKDTQGNRLVFPGMIYDTPEDEPLAPALWSLGQSIRSATGLEMEEGWLDLDRASFPHVTVEVTSPGFAHGGETAYVFDGPFFHGAQRTAAQ